MFLMKFSLVFSVILSGWAYAQTQAQSGALSDADFCLSLVRENGSSDFAIPGPDGLTVTHQCTNWLRQNGCETGGGAGGPWLVACQNNLRLQMADVQKRYREHIGTETSGIPGQTGFLGVPTLSPLNALNSCLAFMRVHTSAAEADFSGFCSAPSPAFRAFICAQSGVTNCSSDENFQKALYGFLDAKQREAKANPGKHVLDFLREYPVEMNKVEASIIARMQAEGKNICRLSQVTNGNQTYMALEVMSSSGWENGTNANPTIVNTLPSLRDH